MYLDYYERIQTTINFIEKNIKNPVSKDIITRVSGMSLTNLYHMFFTFTGHTVKTYIRKRRLTLAAMDLFQSEKRILDIALDYQFQSQESFSRSFKSMFGITPGKYRLLTSEISTFERMTIMTSSLNNNCQTKINTSVTLEPAEGYIAEELMNMLNNDEKLRKQIHCSKPFYNLDEFIEIGRKWSERTNGVNFAICIGGHAVGSIALSHINASKKTATFGFWISYQYWNQSEYEAEAFSQLLTLAKRFGIKTLIAHKVSEREKNVLSKYGVELNQENNYYYGNMILS